MRGLVVKLPPQVIWRWDSPRAGMTWSSGRPSRLRARKGR